MNKIPKLLILAVIIAFILRFWHLTTIPNPPDGDEIAFGYYGWSLLHFGTDEFGNHFPINFSSIGDYKYPGLAYLNIIPALLFGLNGITTRFWAATSGVVLVFLVYLLAYYLFSNKRVSIVAAWAMALSPWSIVLSRQGYETLIATTLTTAGVVCFLYSTRFKKRKAKYLIGSSLLLFIIDCYTYAAARFFIPVFLILLSTLSFFTKTVFAKQKKNLTIFLIVISFIMGISILSPKNFGRAGEDIWKGIDTTENNRLQELYIGAGTSIIKLPPRITWLFHNKYRIAVFDFINRYSDHFSVGFLFTKGEEIGQKIPDMGVLILIDLLLLPFGIVALIKKPSGDAIKLLFAWLIIAPIPSALTASSSKMIRSTLLLVPFTILSGLGFDYLINLFKNKKTFILLILILGIMASSVYSLNQIFVQKPLDKPWTKQEINQELTGDILNIKHKYKAVATGGDDYIFFLFYGKISPKDFIAKSIIDKDVRWNRVLQLANIYFNMPFKCPRGGKLNVLYVCEGVEVPQNSKIIKSYYYPDGVPAYSLIEFYPVSKMPSKLPEPPDKFHYMVQVEDKYPDGIIPEKNSNLW